MNCSSALGEKPVRNLRLSSLSQSHERRECRKLSLARVASTPVQYADVPPLWSIAKTPVASCERLDSAAWLALALGLAALLIGSCLSLLWPHERRDGGLENYSTNGAT